MDHSWSQIHHGAFCLLSHIQSSPYVVLPKTPLSISCERLGSGKSQFKRSETRAPSNGAHVANSQFMTLSRLRALKNSLSPRSPTARSGVRVIGILAFLTAVSSCQQTLTPRDYVQPTTPTFHGSSQPITSVANRRVLVLSPVSVQQVASALTLETRTVPSTAGNTAEGVFQTEDYNAATSAAEAALLNAGWRPVSQAILARAATDASVRASLEALQGQAATSLLQRAMIIGHACSAESVFLIRAVSMRADPSPLRPTGVAGGGYLSTSGYQATVDAVIVRTEDGEVLWAGEATARSTDLLGSPFLHSGINNLERSDFSSRPQFQDTLCEETCTVRPHGALTLVQLAVQRLGEELARQGHEASAVSSSGGSLPESPNTPDASVNPQACSGGRQSNSDTAGHCCWSGQAWSSARGSCVGAPTCPTGMHPNGEDCAP